MNVTVYFWVNSTKETLVSAEERNVGSYPYPHGNPPIHAYSKNLNQYQKQTNSQNQTKSTKFLPFFEKIIPQCTNKILGLEEWWIGKKTFGLSNIKGKPLKPQYFLRNQNELPPPCAHRKRKSWQIAVYPFFTFMNEPLFGAIGSNVADTCNNRGEIDITSKCLSSRDIM